MPPYTVVKQLHFCYGHRLLHYEGKCQHPHGHNGLLEIELGADALDARGMVIDFSDVKQIIGKWLDAALDHKMILHREDPLVPVLQQMGEPVFLIEENPTAENIAKVIYTYAKLQQLPVTAVRLWETPTSYAAYRP